MATSGFQVNGADLTAKWPDKSYLIDRYPEFADTFKQAGLWMWGQNTYGQLGNGVAGHTSSPIQTIAGGTNWKSIAVGFSGTASGIKTDGTLWTWGINYGGELGNNTRDSKSSPIQTVAGGTNWKQSSHTETSTAAIKTDGTLWVWGKNDYGQLGKWDNIKYSSPVQTVSGGSDWKLIACGRYYVGAIKTNGSLWLWGKNNYGQLGFNNTTHQSSPVQTVAGGTNWKQVSCSDIHTAAVKTDGTLWLWGKNNYGQLGTNNTTNTSSPVQTISAGTNWKQVSCGWAHTAAIKTDGTLWLFGNNLSGGLGDNTVVKTSSPIQTIAGGTNWKQVSAGRFATSAIKTDGTLWGWGSNSTGILADETLNDVSSPIQTVAGGTNWKQISINFRVAGAIRDDSSDPI